MLPQKTAVIGAEEVLHQIEKAAEREFLPIIGPYKGKILSQEIRKAKPQRVLEVGTLIGYSAILMGRELNEKAEIITIEIHRGESETAEQNIVKSSIKPKIKIIIGNALKVIPTLTGKFDFAFIDAEKTEYLRYLTLAEDKMRKRAVIVSDNAGIFAEQMSDYLDYVRNSGKYQSKFVQVGGDGLEISVKL
jgi:predicted O-methyltransferase YrrM